MSATACVVFRLGSRSWSRRRPSSPAALCPYATTKTLTTFGHSKMAGLDVIGGAWILRFETAVWDEATEAQRRTARVDEVIRRRRADDWASVDGPVQRSRHDTA